MVHVLPGHAVHVPEVNVVCRIQLIEASPFAVVLVTGGGVELGTQTGLHGNRQGHTTVDMEGKGFDIHTISAITDLSELVVAFERGVNASTARSELLDCPATDGMPVLIRRTRDIVRHRGIAISTRSAVMPDIGGFQDHACNFHRRPHKDHIAIIRCIYEWRASPSLRDVTNTITC